MDPLKHSFSAWEQSSADAGALRELLARPAIWDQQRSDVAEQPVLINALHPGSFLSIFRDSKPRGFMHFIPQKCGLYEVHIGFDKGISVFQMVNCLRRAVHEMFTATPAAILAAPCPDWNTGILRLAGIVKRALLAGKDSRFQPYRVKHLARRDGEDFGATVFPFSRGEWSAAIQPRSNV